MNEETTATNNTETPELAGEVDTLPMDDVNGDAPVDNEEQYLDEGDEEDESGSFDNEPSTVDNDVDLLDEPSDEENELNEVSSVEALKKVDKDMQDAILGNSKQPPEPDSPNVPPDMSPEMSEKYPPFGLENEIPEQQQSAQPNMGNGSNAIPSHLTYDGSRIPTYEEALKQVKPDYDDFYFEDLGINDGRLHEYTTTLWYKIRTPKQPNGRDYKVLGMPKYPKFLERLGVKNISEASLMQIWETFRPTTLEYKLEKEDANRAIVLTAQAIVSRMVKEHRLTDGTLTSADMDFIAKNIPDYSEGTILSIKEYIRRVYETDQNAGPTLFYGPEPRMDCLVSDLNTDGGKLVDGVPLTKRDVDLVNEATRKVAEQFGKGPKMPPMDVQQLKTLFSRHKDIPGSLFTRISKIPPSSWNISLERNLFMMNYDVGVRSIRIEVMLNADRPAFFNINCSTMMDGSGSMKYHESYDTVEEMATSGPNALRLLRFVAGKFSSITA
jgi:hypothetical protein